MGQSHHPLVCHRPSCWAGFVCLVLIGCTTQPPPPVVKVVDNPEKDKYITRIEHEASEASAALKVAKDGVTPPHSKLVDLTIVRLDGIKPPSQKQVDAFKATLGSTKELKKAEDKAGRVDEETSALYTMIEEQDLENQSLREANEAILRDKAYGELRAKCFTLGSWFLIGGAMLSVAASVVPVVPRASGFTLILMAMLCFAFPFAAQDLIEAVWFKWTFGTLVVGCLIGGAVTAYRAHTHVKGRLT
jgi:hypothetical protein